MIRLDFNKTYSVDVELMDHILLGYCLMETWYNEKGEIERPADKAPVIAYDPDTGRVIYRAWPNKDGKLRKRPNNMPTQIIEHDDDPCMNWYGEDGAILFVARPSDVERDPQTGNILRYIYTEPPRHALPTFKHLTIPKVNYNLI